MRGQNPEACGTRRRSTNQAVVAGRLARRAASQAGPSATGRDRFSSNIRPAASKAASKASRRSDESEARKLMQAATILPAMARIDAAETAPASDFSRSIRRIAKSWRSRSSDPAALSGSATSRFSSGGCCSARLASRASRSSDDPNVAMTRADGKRRARKMAVSPSPAPSSTMVRGPMRNISSGASSVAARGRTVVRKWRGSARTRAPPWSISVWPPVSTVLPAQPQQWARSATWLRVRCSSSACSRRRREGLARPTASSASAKASAVGQRASRAARRSSADSPSSLDWRTAALPHLDPRQPSPAWPRPQRRLARIWSRDAASTPVSAL